MGIGNLSSNSPDRGQSAPAPSSPLLRSPQVTVPNIVVDDVMPPGATPPSRPNNLNVLLNESSTDLLMDDVIQQLESKDDVESESSKESTVVPTHSISEMIV